MKHHFKHTVAALALLLTAVLAGLAFSGPVMAVAIEPRTGDTTEPSASTGDTESSAADTSSTSQASEPSFDLRTADGFAKLRFGSNLLYAGNAFSSDDGAADGLLFGFGNALRIKSQSTYGIVAGNSIIYSGTTSRDLFMAGNTMAIAKEAQIGGDIYATGNTLSIEGDLSGSVSFAGDTITIEGGKIAGNLNLSARQIVFKAATTIDGAWIYNDNAEITGFELAKAHETSTYTPVSYNPTPTTIWLGLAIAVVSATVLFFFIVWLFPHTKDRVASSIQPSYIFKFLLSGLGFVFLTPLLSVLLLMTVLATPVGLVVLVIFFLAVYLAQIFAGAWLGRLLMSKMKVTNFPATLETLLGVAILECVKLIPQVGSIVGLLATLLGLGVLFYVMRSKMAAESDEDIPSKTLYKGESKDTGDKDSSDTTSSTKKSSTPRSKTTASKSSSKSAKKSSK